MSNFFFFTTNCIECEGFGGCPKYSRDFFANLTTNTPLSSSPPSLVQIHDPYPDSTFLDTSEPYGWCMVFEGLKPDLEESLIPTSRAIPALPKFAINRAPFYIKGRYTKLRRDCPQTPFFINTGANNLIRLGRSSVEDEITSVVSKSFGGVNSWNNIEGGSNGSSLIFGKCKFHGSGREDMDVRMLKVKGGGRPFVCEVVDGRTFPFEEDLNDAVKILNGTDVIDSDAYSEEEGGVGVSELVLTTSDKFSNLQKETEDKVKHYGCVCWSSIPIKSQKHLDSLGLTSDTPTDICQSTPVRVLHRRAATVRERQVLYMKAEFINTHWFKLWLSTNAGTYVKEFVTGDLGRTSPSVAELIGGTCDILQLDCVGLDMISDTSKGSGM